MQNVAMCSDEIRGRHGVVRQSVASLDGNWLPIAAYVSGQVLPVQELRIARLVLAGGTYEIHDREQRVVDSGAVRVDTDVSPASLDIVGHDGPGAGKTMLAIFELDGDLLTICYDMEASLRPETMEPQQDQVLLQITYSRAARRQ